VQPLLQWKSNQCYIFRVCIYSLRYPVCNAHAPYCLLWPDRLYKIFPQYLTNIVVKKLPNIKCVFGFSRQTPSQIFLILRRNERDIIINVHWSSRKVPVILARS